MTKKHFIALAEHIKRNRGLFSRESIETLADFLRSQNAQFKKDRWIEFIEGKCGQNGGKI